MPFISDFSLSLDFRFCAFLFWFLLRHLVFEYLGLVIGLFGIRKKTWANCFNDL